MILISFQDWLLARESSPQTRSLDAFRKGLGVPKADIYSRSTPPDGDKLEKKLRNHNRKKKRKKKHKVDLPEASKYPTAVNATIDKALDSFEGLEKDWKQLLDLVDKMRSKVEKEPKAKSDQKQSATVKDDEKKLKQKTLFGDDEPEDTPKKAGKSKKEKDDEKRSGSDRVRKRVPVAGADKTSKGEVDGSGKRGKGPKSPRRPPVQTMRGKRQAPSLFRGSDEKGRGDDD